VKRRTLLLAVASTAVCGALPAPRAIAQAAKAPRRIGVLGIGSVAGGSTVEQALADGLRAQGYVQGRDIVLDARWGGGRTDGLAQLAAQLVATKPAVIVASGPQATQAVLAADAGVAVVALLGDAVGSGFADQLGRPGGRLTGVSFLGTPLNAKRLELLAELLPKGSAVLNLGDPGAHREAVVDAIHAAARSLGLVSHTAHAGTAQDIDKAFVTAQRLRVAGVNVLGSPFLNGNRMRIIELAAKARLPAIYQWPQSARDGGLLAYGPSLAAMHQQLAALVARILGGAKAGDLPIEQPTKFELVINLKTARAIGVRIPQSLLLRADEVIE
jgi:putative tryptophan/tyrosine transport system substrate-binding protein